MIRVNQLYFISLAKLNSAVVYGSHHFFFGVVLSKHLISSHFSFFGLTVFFFFYHFNEML